MEPAVAEIDLTALRHNLGVVRQCAPGLPVLAMLKGNAYGHGLLEAARTLHADIDGIGVARLEEALQLRAVGLTNPIVVLAGATAAEQLPLFVQHQLQPVVHSTAQIDLLEQAQLEQPLSVWLKVDSGMHRVGLPPEKIPDALARLRACAVVTGVPTLLTHFACADHPSREETEQQLAAFSAAAKGHEGAISMANSAAIVGWPQTHQGWLRPGVMLYGGSPIVGESAAHFGLQPVMTLRSLVLSVRRVNRGEAVGYSGTWRAERDTRIAVITAGYGDGYPRHTPNGTPVLIKGKEYPRVGRVSMDLMTIDIGLDDDIQPGDEVVLWGKGLPAERIAELAGTITYELFCQVTRRVPFRYLYA